MDVWRELVVHLIRNWTANFASLGWPSFSSTTIPPTLV